MDATAVMPTDGNVTIRVLCRNRRLLLYCAVTVRLLLSAEANPQFRSKWIMDSLFGSVGMDPIDVYVSS